MPVTIKPADHLARPWNRHDVISNPTELLKEANPGSYNHCKELLQSSFTKFGRDELVYASENGFVHAALDAYNQHLHLKIRADDVWFSILSQLSMYINKNAEELRSFFVPHQGQKEVVVKAVGTRYTVDFGAMADAMSAEIGRKVNDPDLRDWVMPAFTTTTSTDRVVASIMFMGAMQKYFYCRFALSCGIPSVTLLGERADWQALLERLDKIPQLGAQPTQFHGLLKPVLTRFLRSFDAPDHPDTVSFWGNVAHEHRNFSGPNELSGWITAFCFWNTNGHVLGDREGDEEGFRLDDALYHRIEIEDIPLGQASVPVLLDDNGAMFETTMVAGLVGIKVTASCGPVEQREPNEQHKSEEPREPEPVARHGPSSDEETMAPTIHDTLQPVSGWWLFVRKEPKPVDTAKHNEWLARFEKRWGSSLAGPEICESEGNSVREVVH